MNEPLVYFRNKFIDSTATGERANAVLFKKRLKKKHVAKWMDMQPSQLSELLSGKRVWTEGIAAQFRKAINGKKAST